MFFIVFLFLLVGCQTRIEDRSFIRLWGSSTEIKQVMPKPPVVEVEEEVEEEIYVEPAPRPAPRPEPRPKPEPEPFIVEEEQAPIGDRVFFGYDKYDTTGMDVDFSARFREHWVEQGSPQLMIDGHCDERGERVYNIGLGMRRASAVKKALVAVGIPESKISLRSYGNERPIVLGSDEAAWAQNRVAIIRLVD